MNISKLKSQFKLYYVGLSALCCVGVAYVCGEAVSTQTQETELARSGVTISPSSVQLGTHSSAVVPLVSDPSLHNAAPMISGSTVRNYARGGHAVSAASVTAAPKHASAGKIRTTAVGSGAVRTSSGGGGSAGGSGASSSAAPRRASSASGAAGASSSIGVVPMPMMAMASRSYAAESNVMGASATADETLSGKTSLGGKKDGSTPGNPGTPDNPIQPPIPVGGTPWLLLMLLALLYMVRRDSKRLL